MKKLLWMVGILMLFTFLVATAVYAEPDRFQVEYSQELAIDSIDLRSDFQTPHLTVLFKKKVYKIFGITAQVDGDFSDFYRFEKGDLTGGIWARVIDSWIKGEIEIANKWEVSSDGSFINGDEQKLTARLYIPFK